MIKKVYIGRKVVVDNPMHCGGFHKKGTTGTIVTVLSKASFEVIDKLNAKWWYCQKCVSPLGNKVNKKPAHNTQSVK